MRGRQLDRNERIMRKVNSDLTQAQREQLAALERLRDDQIDTTDIPETLDWSGARRGVFYQPVEQKVTLRLDVDVVSWFKANVQDGCDYRKDINLALCEYISGVETKRAEAAKITT